MCVLPPPSHSTAQIEETQKGLAHEVAKHQKSLEYVELPNAMKLSTLVYPSARGGSGLGFYILSRSSETHMASSLVNCVNLFAPLLRLNYLVGSQNVHLGTLDRKLRRETFNPRLLCPLSNFSSGAVDCR